MTADTHLTIDIYITLSHVTQSHLTQLRHYTVDMNRTQICVGSR